MIDKDKTEETKKFLINKAQREDIVQAIQVTNNELAADVKNIATNLSRLGVLDDYRKPRGDNRENVENDASSYNGSLNKDYIKYSNKQLKYVFKKLLYFSIDLPQYYQLNFK